MRQKKCLMILNHNPVKELQDELSQKNYKVDLLSSELKNIWGNIPETTDKKELHNFLQPLLDEALLYNMVVIAGEPTAVYHIVSDLQSMGIDCYAPVSKRVSIDVPQEDGTVLKKSVFKYKGLREY